MKDLNFCPNCGHNLKAYKDNDSVVDEPDIYADVERYVIEAGKTSTSSLQRKFRIGYGKASRLIDRLEENGIVGETDGKSPRKVLASRSS